MTAPITCIHGHEYQTAFWGECPKCQAQRTRRLSELTAESVRRLKAAMEGEDEKAAYSEAQQLRELGHPDVDGLCLSIRTRLDRGTAKSAGRTNSGRTGTASKWSSPSWLRDD